jgi:hypothetical protein
VLRTARLGYAAGVTGEVFVSYSHVAPDTEYVQRLAAFLADAGVRAWYDKDLVPGDSWAETIKQRIDNCAAVIVVMTPEAERSEWVQREIAYAQFLKRPILPLLLRGDPFFRLVELQYDDVSGGRTPADGFVARIKELASVDQPAETAPAPPLDLKTRTGLCSDVLDQLDLVSFVAPLPVVRQLQLVGEYPEIHVRFKPEPGAAHEGPGWSEDLVYSMGGTAINFVNGTTFIADDWVFNGLVYASADAAPSYVAVLIADDIRWRYANPPRTIS